MTHIKIIYRGITYGPIEAPTCLKVICDMVHVSMDAKPSLENVVDKTKCISNPLTPITAGVYELYAIPNIPFQEERKQDYPVRIPRHGVVAEGTQTVDQEDQIIPQRQQEMAVKSLRHQNLPLAKNEMQETVDGMVHLLTTIPPRYIKYNKQLSLQIELGMEEVDKLLAELEELYVLDVHQKHISGVSVGTMTTFVQYRTLHIMHDIWKKVWTRFAPARRVFNVSKIFTLHTLEQAEHIFNCLSSWRRMLDSNSWSKIKTHVQKEIGSCQNIKKKSYGPQMLPGRLPGEEDAGNHVQLAINMPKQSDNTQEEELRLFRLAYLKLVAKEGAYRNMDLRRILESMLRERRLSSTFPVSFIRQQMEQEFRIC
jgi:hypothetical protein